MDTFLALAISHGLVFVIGFAAGGIICYRWAKRSKTGKEALEYIAGQVTKAGKK